LLYLYLLALRDPIPMQGIPGAVLVGAFAFLADERCANFACIPPIPAHGSQVIAARRPEADGTILALS
jgi:hypothetical protein